ncbi:MAG: hypothetical protein EP330_14295 [Deltaproteobacteria bacterium]|nr:MAG: hypothetical protein EP330_14295 [Deltaproteobacteria bacterium]
MLPLLTVLIATAVAHPPGGDLPPELSCPALEAHAPEGAPPPMPLFAFAYDEDDSGDLDPAEMDLLVQDFQDGCDAFTKRGAPTDAPPPPPPPRGERPPKGELPPPIIHAFDTDGDGQLDARERGAARARIQQAIREGRPPVPPPPRGERPER